MIRLALNHHHGRRQSPLPSLFMPIESVQTASTTIGGSLCRTEANRTTAPSHSMSSFATDRAHHRSVIRIRPYIIRCFIQIRYAVYRTVGCIFLWPSVRIRGFYSRITVYTVYTVLSVLIKSQKCHSIGSFYQHMSSSYLYRNLESLRAIES